MKYDIKNNVLFTRITIYGNGTGINRGSRHRKLTLLNYL